MMQTALSSTNNSFLKWDHMFSVTLCTCWIRHTMHSFIFMKKRWRWIITHQSNNEALTLTERNYCTSRKTLHFWNRSRSVAKSKTPLLPHLYTSCCHPAACNRGDRNTYSCPLCSYRWSYRVLGTCRIHRHLTETFTQPWSQGISNNRASEHHMDLNDWRW